MCLVQCFEGAPRLRMHPSWARAWRPDIDEPDLRRRIFENPRFAGRIVDTVVSDAFGHADRPGGAFEGEARLAWFLSCDQPRVLHRAGILWFAPTLAGDLLRPASLARLGLTEKEDLKAVLAFRDHAPAATVGVIDAGADHAIEGAACLNAWVGALPRAVADRARLCWPAHDAEIAEVESRRRFFDAFIARCMGAAS